MADPWMTADAPTAMASGQFIVQNYKDWQKKMRSMGLAVTTDLNFASQMLLKDEDQQPIFKAAHFSVADLQERLQAYEAMTAPQAVGVVPLWLLLLLQTGIPAIKELIERLLKGE